MRLVNFRKIGPRRKARHLERYFDSHIAPLLSPIMVGKRQPFPFLRNKEIYAVAYPWTGKNGKEQAGADLLRRRA